MGRTAARGAADPAALRPRGGGGARRALGRRRLARPRLRRRLMPCSEYLGDLWRLTAAPRTRWAQPTSSTRRRRRGWSTRRLPHRGGARGALVVFGGRSLAVNSTTRAEDGVYMNDVGPSTSRRWRGATAAAGDAARRRGRRTRRRWHHGRRVLLFGGQNAYGELGDLHVLASAASVGGASMRAAPYARARMAHAAIRIGWDVLFSAGCAERRRQHRRPRRWRRRTRRLQPRAPRSGTSALLGPRLDRRRLQPHVRARPRHAKEARRSSGAARGGQISRVW